MLENEPLETNEGNIWDKIVVPLRQESEGIEKATESKDFEEATERRSSIAAQQETPSLTVAQIREKFSKGGAALFPKQVFGAARPKVKQPTDSPIAISKQMEFTERTLSFPEEDRSLNTDDFYELAKMNGSDKAIDRWSTPRNVEVGIKPEGQGAKVVVKQMELKFDDERRLLVMSRKGHSRYIRLDDVVCIENVHPGPQSEKLLAQVPAEFRTQRHHIALHFSATENPMLIMMHSEEDKIELLKLIIFMRQVLKTDIPLELKV